MENDDNDLNIDIRSETAIKEEPEDQTEIKKEPEDEEYVFVEDFNSEAFKSKEVEDTCEYRSCEAYWKTSNLSTECEYDGKDEPIESNSASLSREKAFRPQTHEVEDSCKRAGSEEISRASDLNTECEVDGQDKSMKLNNTVLSEENAMRLELLKRQDKIPSGQKELEKITMRARIIEMRIFGKQIGEIAKELGFARQTVGKWIKRWELEGNLNTYPRSGAPRKTTQQQDQEIIKALKTDPLTNAQEIKRKLQLPITDHTIRIRLREAAVERRSKGSRLNDIELRPIIMEMRESGKHVYEIAREIGVHRHTVTKWIRRWEEEGYIQDHPRPSKLPKTIQQPNQQIPEAIGKDPHSNSGQANEICTSVVE